MKQIKCNEMGGPADCETVITGTTPEEMVENGMKHVGEAHPELAKEIMARPKEESDKWMEEFKAKFPMLADA